MELLESVVRAQGIGTYGRLEGMEGTEASMQQHNYPTVQSDSSNRLPRQQRHCPARYRQFKSATAATQTFDYVHFFVGT